MVGRPARDKTNPNLDKQVQAAVAQYHRTLKTLEVFLKAKKRFPHEGQFPVIRAFFYEKKRIIMSQWGRDGGKTEVGLFCAWRFAATAPNRLIYIVAPELDQGKEIYLASGRLEHYGPREFLAPDPINKTEARCTFANGSVITVVGCRNMNALRGVKPHLVMYDEFQHHSSDFDQEVMQPNLSSGKVSLLIFGTPPKRACYYTEFKSNLLEHIKNGSEARAYFEMPCWVNPNKDRKWLDEKRDELIRQKKHAVWLREYEGKDAYDQEGAVFPMFSREDHIFPHDQLLNEVRGDAGKIRWFAVFDPGTATCFAVLFLGWDPHTGTVYILDEIYEKDRSRITASAIWERANGVKTQLGINKSRWHNIYDSAASWFANEIIAGNADREHFSLAPVHKGHGNRSYAETSRPGESLLMDLMLIPGRFRVSERAANFLWEMNSYVRDEKGRYPKTNDHLIDCLYYFALESGFKLLTEETEEEKEARLFAQSRSTTPEDYYVQKRSSEDPFFAMEHIDDVYDEDYGWN